MIEWKEKKYSSFKEYIEKNTNMEVKDFFACNTKEISNLDVAVMIIEEYIEAGLPIHFIGDYDCDGICSIYIAMQTVKAAGGVYTTRLPRRFTDGYGMSEKMVDELISTKTSNNELIVTIDNGIAAREAINKAKLNGFTVLVIDHHKCPTDSEGNFLYPNADCIVNESAGDMDETQKGYTPYCGAGLALKICLQIAEDYALSKELVNSIKVAASIATVADAVKLINGNRKIVIEGLELINKAHNGKCMLLTGLETLFLLLKIERVNSETLGFNIGPMFNAPGRLFDNGAKLAFDIISEEDVSKAESGIRTLMEYNNTRKQKTVDNYAIAKSIIETEGMTAPFTIYSPDFDEGICGITAGKLSEEYGCPAVVFTDTEVSKEVITLAKGSGRACEGQDLMAMLKSCEDYIVRYGGHPQAAGIAVNLADINDFRKALSKAYKPEEARSDIKYYDFEIKEDEINSWASEMEKIEPFGVGIKSPIFKMRIELSPQDGKYYSTIKGNGIKLFGKNANFLGFGMLEKYKECGEPVILDVYGTISLNYFKEKVTPQMNMVDFAPAKIEKTKSLVLDSISDLAKTFLS